MLASLGAAGGFYVLAELGASPVVLVLVAVLSALLMVLALDRYRNERRAKALPRPPTESRAAKTAFTPYGPPTPMRAKMDEVRERAREMDAQLYRIDPAQTRRMEEMTAKATEKRADFKYYAQELAGWFKSYHPVPPDPAEMLGERFEDETGMKLVDGEITRAQYENLVQPFTERRKWEEGLRSDYQRNKRANVIRWLDWAKGTGEMTGAEAVALITAKEPRTPEDFNELVDAFERIAERL